MVDKAQNRKQRKVKRTTNILDFQEIENIEYNRIAGAEKSLAVGGRWIPKGALLPAVTAFGAGNGKIIEVFNPTGAPVFFLSGDSTLAVPTDAATGIPILAGETRKISLGDHTYMAASAAGMFFYELDDDTHLVKRNPAN